MNLETILSQRHAITEQERNGIRDTLDSIDNKIKSLTVRLGTKPKDTVETINAKVRTLEHEHATTTQSKSDERNFMRELERLGQLKKQAVEYQKMKDEFDALKEQRADLFQELRIKEKSLDELDASLRRVRLAGKLQCSTKDIIEQTFAVPEEAIPRVIGKKGQNLKQIESDHNVSIETERADRTNTATSNTSIRIMGTEAAISKAYTAIMNVVNTSSLVIKPSDETIVCLLLNKAALNSDIQTRHNVRLDTSRARNECKITGVGSAIAAAVVEINKIDSHRVQIENVEASVLPFIVGKGGAVIKSLEEEHNVQIDILREENRITLLGLRQNVDSATAFLQNLVVENKEVEDTIKANRHVIITCILGVAGATCKQLQKDLNASIKVVRSVGDNDLDTIVIRGSAAKVANAKAHLITILRAFYSQTCRVEVPKDCLPVIVGKKGSKINSLRDEHPGSTIDIEGLVVYIQSPSEASRLAIKKSIENLVASNYVKAVSISPDLAISFKGTRGADLRELYTNTLELGFEIEPDNATMKLRGKQENVEKGFAALQLFIRDNYSEDVVCDLDDCTAFATADREGGETPQKRVEAEHKVDIYVNRKDGILRVRGTEVSVKNAIAAIDKFIAGDINLGSYVIAVNKQAFSAVIGKAGATLKKIESTHEVKLDLLKNKGLVRIRGPKENIISAKQYLSKFLDEVRSTLFVDIPPAHSAIVTDEFMSQHENMFHVEIGKSDFNANKLTIKGLIRLVDFAFEHLSNLLDEVVHVKVRASQSQIAYLNSTTKFKELEGKFSEINIVANADAGEIICSGPPHEAADCRKDVLQILKSRFPAEFTSYSLSTSCLLDVASKNTEWLTEPFGVGVAVDLPLQVVHVFGTAASVKAAVESLRNRQISWVDMHPSLPIDEYLLPNFVGKNGSGILQLEKDLQVRVKVNRAEKRVELESSDKDLIQKAVKFIIDKIEDMKSRHWEVTMPPDLLGLFIGKEGSSIKKFRLETNVNVDVDNATGLVRVSYNYNYNYNNQKS